MSSATPKAPPRLIERLAYGAMGTCLGVMATAVFVNVVLRYGFGSGIAASEELSRLLFVWMVFIGATLAYPAGEHMAFTMIISRFAGHAVLMAVLTRLIHALVLLACALVGWGAWQQVMVGLHTTSVVLGYPVALLPLPAFLAATAIGVMALVQFVRGTPLHLHASAETE